MSLDSHLPLPDLLPVATVQRIERLVGGDPVTEEQILRFIAGRYGAKSLLELPPAVATEILKRPADFVRAAKRYCEPELALWRSRELRVES